MTWILRHKVFHPMLLLLTLQHELVARAGPIPDNSSLGLVQQPWKISPDASILGPERIVPADSLKLVVRFNLSGIKSPFQKNMFGYSSRIETVQQY
jgi:hypothetical protein